MAIAAHGSEPFTTEDVERARRYHRPGYLLLPVDIALGLGVPAAFAFGPPGRALDRALRDVPWWGRALAYPGCVVGAATAVRLPLAFWRGYVREKRWGFSTQTVGGWVVDRAKALGIGVTLTSPTFLGLTWLARRMPSRWPLVAAPLAGGSVALLSFVAPVLLEPVFNRFEPLEDGELRSDLLALAEEVGVPVRDVLVADASRRTRKENAYVSGLGRTRRVVVYDTLLRRGEPRQLRLVVAHELGHRRLRHVAKGTALGIGAAMAGVAGMAALLRSRRVLHRAGAKDAGDPKVVPLVMLAGEAIGLLTAPLQTALSRRWERAADRFSLEATGDLEAFEAAHVDLARSNLSDLDPPRALYMLLFTHPTPPERIAVARDWADASR